MTLEEEYDRWERFAKLWSARSIRESRDARKQTEKLKLYVDAVKKYDAAKLALEERPEDSDTNESLLSARQILDQAREELKYTTENARRDAPK